MESDAKRSCDNPEGKVLNIPRTKGKEPLASSLISIIFVSSIIVIGGALFGAIMYLAINYSMPVKVAEPIRVPNKELIKADAKKYLPKDYSILSDDFLFYKDIDDDKNPEIIVLAKKENKAEETLFVLKSGILGYSINEEFVSGEAVYFEDVIIRDSNGNNIPEIIYVTTMGAGESMPRKARIYEWNGADYDLLLSKSLSLPIVGRPAIKSWSNNFIRDMNSDNAKEIIIPDVGVYQASCGNIEGCLSLLKYEVYKWEDGKYSERIDEFLQVYDEDVKLANEILNNQKTSEDNKAVVRRYLRKIEDLKAIAEWKTYRNEEYGYEFKYPDMWNAPTSKENKDKEITFGCLKNESNSDCSLSIKLVALQNKEVFIKSLKIDADKRNDTTESNLKMENIIVDNRSAVSYSIGGVCTEGAVAIFNSENTILFSDSCYNVHNSYEGYFEKILSTFKFIEKETSNLADEEIKLLPPNAKIIETRNLKDAGYQDRTLVLWMITPSNNPKTDDIYTCPETTRGSYYSGPARLSLLDTKKKKHINTIEIKYTEDSFDIPYNIKKDAGPYFVEKADINGSGAPDIMFLKDYNGDGKALEFALFNSMACIEPLSSLFGYSELRDRVIQYPIKLTTERENKESQEEVLYWASGLFSMESKKPGSWENTFDSRGRGGCIEKQTTSYNKKKEFFQEKLIITDCKDAINN